MCYTFDSETEKKSNKSKECVRLCCDCDGFLLMCKLKVQTGSSRVESNNKNLNCVKYKCQYMYKILKDPKNF